MISRSHVRRFERRHQLRRGVGLNLVSLMDIFTILVFFLLVTASDVEELPNSNSVDLPVATAERPPEDGLTLYITDQSIILDEYVVMSVEDALNTESIALPPLYQALKQPADAERPELGYRITVLADRDIPYRLLKRILATCAQAEFSSVALAINKAVQEGEAS